MRATAQPFELEAGYFWFVACDELIAILVHAAVAADGGQLFDRRGQQIERRIP